MKMFDTEMFISEVEKRPALYNARHKEYSDRDLKYKLWDEIAAAMYKNWETLPGQECRKKVKELRVKWKSIRDHFKKEVALEKKYRSGQASTRKKRKYIYYDQLLFLLTDEEKEAISTVKIKEEIHTSPSRILEEDLELEEYDTVDYNISNPAGLKQEDTKSNATKRTQQKVTPSSTAEEITIAQIQEVRYSAEDTMGNRDFLMSLLPLMNKLPDYAIVHLRLKIMELFQMFTLPNSEQYASYQQQQQQQQQQHSYPTSTIAPVASNTSNNNPSTSTPMSPDRQNSGSGSGDNSDDSDMSDSSSDKS